jgi:hypothetical protein
MKRLQIAFHTPNPAKAIKSFVEELSSEGVSKDEIYGLFEKFLLNLRREEDFEEEDEDLVLDLMDALTGWCSPQGRLLPD